MNRVGVSEKVFAANAENIAAVVLDFFAYELWIINRRDLTLKDTFNDPYKKHRSQFMSFQDFMHISIDVDQ